MTKTANYKAFLYKNRYFIIVGAIFIIEVFLRFYQINIKNPFGYDQVDNAWAAQNIIANHKFPLVGMVAKADSNIYIGPLYYYLIALFYFLTNLNPIASGIFAGVTSIITFFTIFFVIKKLFSIQTAIIAVFLNTFLMPAIIFDRVQWPVNFIPIMGLVIFYVLYRILLGDIKKILLLAVLVGISFSIHFTSIFYPLIVIFSLPFFPRKKETLKYIALALPLFLIWLIPNTIYQLHQKTNGSAFTIYAKTYYHGFHLRRVMQLTGDALIQFNPYLFSNTLAVLKFILFPAFFFVYLYKSVSREKVIFCYLVMLWFVVPWFIFATYSGEITDYYFAINRFIALGIVAYFFARVWMIKNNVTKSVVIVVLFSLAVYNIHSFFGYKDTGLLVKEKAVRDAINSGQVIKFQGGVPESYLYYYFMRQKGIRVY